MAANSGAYYEGLQYASQGVEPVKFGELALGFAKVVEDKRLQAKQEQEKKEAFQMEMTKLFGEEVYSAFDGTGLADTDIVGAKIKDNIIARANVVNSLYEEGKLSNAQMMQEMVKLNAQSKKYSSFISAIPDKIEEIKKLGGDVSEYTSLMLERVDELMRNAIPVMDDQGNLSFLSKDGETITKNPFNELQRLLDVRQKYDLDSVINTFMQSRGTETIKRDGQVVKKLVDLNERDDAFFENIVNSMDDADKFDIAMRIVGKEDLVKRDPNSIFEIVNKGELDSEIASFIKDNARSRMSQMETVDEVAGLELNMQLQRAYREAEAWKKANEGSVINVSGTEGEGKTIEMYPPPGKKIVVNSLVASGEAISEGTIGSYSLDENGVHRVSITYRPNELTQTLDLDASAGTTGPESTTYRIVKEIVLDNKVAVNQVRTQLGLEPIKELNLPNTPPPSGGELD